MDFFKKYWENRAARKVVIAMEIFCVVIIFISIISSCSNGKKIYTYSELESKMISLAKNKYSKEKDLLPKKDKDIVTVSLQTFVNEEKLKPISEIVENNSACTGNVSVINNNGYYVYIPSLDCGADYKTKTLYDTLTSNVVTEGNGLYQVDNEYIFKGDTVDNYLKLGEKTYRILRINGDGNIRVFDTTKNVRSSWDNRFNVDKNSSVGINNYVTNNINSRIKDAVEEYYKSDDFTDDLRGYFVTHDACVGKRSINDFINDGSLECLEAIPNQAFSLVQANEYFNATLDSNCINAESSSCQNYNFFSSLENTWTITADKDSSYYAYRLNGELTLSRTSNTTNIRVVALLNKDLVLFDGDGSVNNPYIINTFDAIVTNKKS